MGIEIPEALQWVSYLAGESWPKGDETALFRLNGYFSDAAEQLRDLVPSLRRVSTQTESVLSGQTALAAQQNFQMLFTGDYSVDTVADAMQSLGEMARGSGTEVQYTKLDSTPHRRPSR